MTLIMFKLASAAWSSQLHNYTHQKDSQQKPAILLDGFNECGVLTEFLLCAPTSAPAAYSMAWSDRKSFLAVW